MDNSFISESMTVKLDAIFPELPNYPEFEPNIRRAPKRDVSLSKSDIKLALKNALRYIPEQWHEQLAPEFLEELDTLGRIYGFRFRPVGNIKGLPVDEYKGKTLEGRALQVMIDNNLDFDIALYPYELVTYGETGQVCQNWMQYWIIKKYLENIESDQTLCLYSGHPLGVFKSHEKAPRVILTNGVMLGLFDDSEEFARAAALGVSNYGQMTAGGWMYIGPQGIVHGTYNTILNAGRMKLGVPDDGDLSGFLFVSSGLGGMSGAQPKAVEIANGVGIFAEVDYSRIETRHSQGWVGEVTDSAEKAFAIAEEYMTKKETISIAYHGNIVDLLEYAAQYNKRIDLLSDQTSCHAVYEGGYCPQGITFEERTKLLAEDPEQFIKLINKTLLNHYDVIKKLVSRGTYFFDYGNSFMRAIFDAGALDITKNGVDTKDGFIYPSYVEDIMGPVLFDYGYGPFRWVCLSGKKEDLLKTDNAAAECIDPTRRSQDRDNYMWIKDADKNGLVVGTQARILYQDAAGRVKIALRFNEMVRNGEVGPIMIGRDHHDTGGTDSPYRETANIKDGSNVTVDMALNNFAGDCARGMTLCALHNGGGVGISKSRNGGFGLVLDGSERIDEIIKTAMSWDVLNGVTRRAWARNENALETMADYNRNNESGDHVTLPYIPDEKLLDKLIDER